MKRLSRNLVALAIVAAALAGCTGMSSVRPGSTQIGLASWYGPGFQGKPTAGGEHFNVNALTAAHRTLPLNSVVRVTNLENGRSVIVRINDRGPFIHGRILDVSYKAARELGMREDGVARVRIEVLKISEAGS